MPFQENLDTANLIAWRADITNTRQVEDRAAYEAMLREHVRYASGKPTIDSIVYTGTGDGNLGRLDLAQSGVTENWTITLTSATAFTVSGSVSGAQRNGTVGHPYTTFDVSGAATSGTATSLVDSGATFIASNVAVGMSVYNETQDETVRILGVVSETELQTDAITGDWNGDSYTIIDPENSLISFTLTAGATPFVNTDNWVVGVTISTLAVGQADAADRWVVDRWASHSDFQTPENYLHWHGQGDGTQAIHCGIMLTETPASQIYNWILRGFTGYFATNEFDTQLGASPSSFVAFINTDFDYWLTVNARRYTVNAAVNTTYHSLYQGFILPYGSPEEYPYPIVSLGEKADEEAWNSTDGNFSMFLSTKLGSGSIRDIAGVWNSMVFNGVGVYVMWPGNNGSTTPDVVWDNNEDLDNHDVFLFPLVIVSTPLSGGDNVLTGNTYGELDGVYRVSGFFLPVETKLTINTVDYVMLKNIFRSTRDQFWALELV